AVHVVDGALPEGVAGPVVRERGDVGVGGGDGLGVARGVGEERQVCGVTGAHGAGLHIEEARTRSGGGRTTENEERQNQLFHEWKVRAPFGRTNDFSANRQLRSANGRRAGGRGVMLPRGMKKVAALVAAWLPFLALWQMFAMQAGVP